MQYNSVREYFIRLHTLCLIFIFTPVLMFLLVVFLLMIGKLTFVMNDESGELVAYALMFIAILDSLLSFVIVMLMLKPVRELLSLGERLDRYVTAVYVRFAILISGSLMLLVAFYLSGIEWISAVFGAQLILYVISWPTRSRLSIELRLKESEKEVIWE